MSLSGQGVRQCSGVFGFVQHCSAVSLSGQGVRRCSVLFGFVQHCSGVSLSGRSVRRCSVLFGSVQGCSGVSLSGRGVRGCSGVCRRGWSGLGCGVGWWAGRWALFALSFFWGYRSTVGAMRMIGARMTGAAARGAFHPPPNLPPGRGEGLDWGLDWGSSFEGGIGVGVGLAVGGKCEQALGGRDELGGGEAHYRRSPTPRSPLPLFPLAALTQERPNSVFRIARKSDLTPAEPAVHFRIRGHAAGERQNPLPVS